MDLGLDGRVALVTGGSKGIGLGIAAGLAAEGARVAVASRDAGRVRAAAERIGGHGVVFDSGDLDAVPGVIASVEAELGPIDVYVANTGGPPAGPDPLGFTRAEWEAAHRTLVALADGVPRAAAAGDGGARLGARRRGRFDGRPRADRLDPAVERAPAGAGRRVQGAGQARTRPTA